MSHAAISAGVAGRPTPGYAVANADAATRRKGVRDNFRTMKNVSDTIFSVRLHIRHFPALGHLPRLDRVVVVDRPRTAHGAQLVDLRLHVTGFVDRPRLQDCWGPVPHPV